MKKVGLLLSGCGFNDGSEIHESVISMLALDRAGVETVIMAPNIDQMHVVNHYTGQEMDEFRNVLVESSRIARGNIKDMAEVTGNDLDALIIPGGFGVAKNLSDYAMAGPDCSVNPDVYRLVSEIYLLKKPIGAICIAPVMMAKIFGEKSKSKKIITKPQEPNFSKLVSRKSNNNTNNAKIMHRAESIKNYRDKLSTNIFFKKKLVSIPLVTLAML